jgi:hypothetical protein
MLITITVASLHSPKGSTVYEGAVKALPAHHLRRHHGGTVVFVSDFGQQKLFHLKPGSITYRWKALLLKETNMPVK